MKKVMFDTPKSYAKFAAKPHLFSLSNACVIGASVFATISGATPAYQTRRVEQFGGTILND